MQKANIYSKNMFEKVLTFENLFDIINSRNEQMFRTLFRTLIYTRGKNMQYTMDYNYDREYERTIRNRKRAIRRRRQTRRNLFMIVAGVSLILILTFLHKSVITNASDLSAKTYCKYYESIMIEEGDTLWSYAKEYSDNLHYDSNFEYIEEVCFINHLTANDDLIVGNYIVVPYYMEVSATLVSK